MNVLPLPCSVTVSALGSKVTPAVSSSVSVSVTSDGSVTLLPPDTVPETVTDLLSASTSLLFAVTVTVPELVVSPAAIVNVFAFDNAKSAATAPVPAAAATVTVAASLDTSESVAVTVDTPPASPIDVGDNASATVGNVSSSSIVNVTADGAATLLPPEAVPETVTVSSASCVASSTAVTVTVPELVVYPAAIVNSSALDNAKSPAAAVAPVAETVTVTASLDAPESVAVTVAAFDAPLSSIVAGDSASAAVGSASSSSIVNVTLDGDAIPLPPVNVAETVTDLSGASVASFLAVTVTVPVLVVEPAAIVSSVALDRLKSPAAAFAPAAAATVSVTASLDPWFSTAVTVLFPGFVPSCSSIVAGLNASIAVGVASSSMRRRIAPVTVPTPWLFRAAPVTVTLRSPTLSMASSTAVMVAVSAAFAVSPAAITMVASEPTV